jgi:hypothetical protein
LLTLDGALADQVNLAGDHKTTQASHWRRACGKQFETLFTWNIGTIPQIPQERPLVRAD